MKSRSRCALDNESGVTLIEVLGALTIMAVISVTIIGYFISAMDRSADESKRIIASNLSRLKAAEIREVGKAGSNFTDLQTAITATVVINQANRNTLPDPYRPLFDETVVNQTAYYYEVTMEREEAAGSRSEWLTAKMGTASDKYLIPMQVKVYWGSSAANATLLDTYVVNPG